MHRMLRLSLACALTATTLGAGALAAPAQADPATEVRINEVFSNGTDFIELINTGATPADVSGWVLADNSEKRYLVPASTTIAPGGFAAFDVDDTTNPAGGFGLGKGDSARLFLADGTTLLDSYTFPAGQHAASDGRCPDGTGDFVVGLTPTPGAANACTLPEPEGRIVLNEVKSSPNPDFIELYNAGDAPVDLNGWSVLDDDPAHVRATIATTSTVIAPGGFHTVDPGSLTGGFGLGGDDAVTVYDAAGDVADTFTWEGLGPVGHHAIPSYGRCPDGTGAMVLQTSATPGAANDCAGPYAGLVVNEVSSDPADWIELHNTSTATIDLSGVVVKDNDDTRTDALPTGTTIAAGGHLQLVGGTHFSFGLGKGDSARLFTPGGGTLIDGHTWAADTHASTDSRCPDGTGAWVAGTAPTPGAANACAAADPADVRLNEVESNGDVVADWVELTNIGDTPADVSGWKLKDAGATNPFVTIPAGTVIQPGGFYATYTEFPPPGFGLGVDDTITLYQGDGTSMVDEYSWSGGHAATTYGRCPDGTGDWQVTTVATRGSANACSPIRVNEVSTTPTDWVELVNLSGTPVDVTGWVVKDSGDADPTTLSGSVPANGHLVVDTLAAGLGSADSVRLFDPSAELIDSYAWTAHSNPTYARCADGVGAFTTSASATKGTTNDCPGLATEPWFGSQDVVTSDLADTFVQDASGVVFDPADPSGTTLWVAQNKLGTLFRMTKNGATWEPATGWAGGRNPRYHDGTGAPDTEGITIGPDGAVYLAAERDNSVSGISRNTVLRYEPGTSMDATDEWSLNGLLPTLGANLGLEGITWIPDSALTAGGFLDQARGKAYDPADYSNHGTGLYAVAVEGTGLVYVVALEQTAAVQEAAHLVTTIDPELVTDAGPAAAMDVAWDPEASLLRVLCDDSCHGTSVAMAMTGGAFGVTHAYDRPLTMPDLNNEGIALAPQASCVDGRKEVVWSDDGDTDGHSLRSGTVPCTPPVVDPTDPTPTPTPVPVPTSVPTPAVKQPAEVSVSRKRVRGSVGERIKVRLVIASGDAPATGRVKVKVKGTRGSSTVRLEDGRAVIRLPRFTRAGTRTVWLTYLGDARTMRSTTTIKAIISA